MISVVMTSLKIPEDVQNRIFEYYDIKNENKYIRNDHFYQLLNANLSRTVKLF